MGQYIVRRFLLLFVVLFFVSLIVFFSVRLVPGDAVDAQLARAGFGGGNATPEQVQGMRAELGLDKPAHRQYFLWMADLFRGDLGDSFSSRRSVVSELTRSIPVSLELAIIAVIISVVIAIPLGTLAAIHQDSRFDYLVRLVSVGGLAIPDFVLGTLLVVMPAVWFNWTPPLGYRTFFDSPGTNLMQVMLPATVLGFRFSSTTLRMTRSSMLEVLRSDYIVTAWAKGLTPRVVIFRHALKNALIAPITLIGTQLGLLMGGTVIIERIFALPGLGRLTLQAILNGDWPQIQGAVLFLATVFVVANLLVDLSYGWLDPRIRYQ